METQPESVYEELGFGIRYDYFTHLSQLYGIPVMEIIFKAEQLGVDRDFTALMDWVCKESRKCYLTRTKLR